MLNNCRITEPIVEKVFLPQNAHIPHGCVQLKTIRQVVPDLLSKSKGVHRPETTN